MGSSWAEGSWFKMEPCSRVENRSWAAVPLAPVGLPARGWATSPAPRAAPQWLQPAGSFRGGRAAGPRALACLALWAQGLQLAPSRSPARPAPARNRSPGLGGGADLVKVAATAVAASRRQPRRFKGAQLGTHPMEPIPPPRPSSRTSGDGKGCGSVVMEY